jgi:hypothetical protein
MTFALLGASTLGAAVLFYAANPAHDTGSRGGTFLFVIVVRLRFAGSHFSGFLVAACGALTGCASSIGRNEGLRRADVGIVGSNGILGEHFGINGRAAGGNSANTDDGSGYAAAGGHGQQNSANDNDAIHK